VKKSFIRITRTYNVKKMNIELSGLYSTGNTRLKVKNLRSIFVIERSF